MLVAATPVAHAQTVDLVAAVRAAQEHDPTLRAARATLDIALQKWPEARAGLLPVVGLSGGPTAAQATTSFAGLPEFTRSGNASAWSLQLTQPLFHADNLLADQQAPLIIEGAQARYELAQLDLLLRVATAYFAVDEMNDNIAAADAQVAAMERQLLEVSQSFKAGTRAITDVDDTRARLGSARAQQIAAHSDLENAQADLDRLTGLSSSCLAALTNDAVLSPPVPSEAGDWIAQARDSDARVRAQRAAVLVAGVDVERAKTGPLPTVDFVANLGRNFSSHSLTTPDDYSTKAVQRSVGVQFNIPLFAGGAVVVKVNEAESALEKARADLETARDDAASDARHAYSGVLSGLAQVAALGTAVDAAQSALKGNEAGFRVGYRTNVDVLNAQQQLFTARRDLSKARYDVLIQGLKLKMAAGVLSERDIAALSALMR